MYCNACGAALPSDAFFCRSCGSPTGKQEPSQPARRSQKKRRVSLVLGVLSFTFLLALLPWFVIGPDSGSRQKAASAASEKANGPEVQARARIADAKHLISRKDFDGATKALLQVPLPPALPASSQEWQETIRLLGQVDKKTQARLAGILIRLRQRFADDLETQMLDNNIDMTIRTEGRDSQTLRIRWIGIDRPFVHNFMKQGSNIRAMKDLGFTRLILDDALHYRWVYDLVKDDWVR